jgi:predicted KAP-like P-loop ATPase
MDTSTFTSFEDAWSYTRAFPESITYIPYNTWLYVSKKDAARTLEESNRLVVSWSQVHNAEIIITRSQLGVETQ